MSCQNPCGTVPVNSAQSETLPSQIENFTTQFFGTVVKTEVDGVVTWSLPCGLDVGLPANPRGVDEGLACYFLRLFDEGIVGLKGDKGDTGAAGTNGNNAYTVTLATFAQPTLGSPNVQVSMQYNPAIRDDMYIFIADSGWYVVEGSDGFGTYFLRLVYELPTPAVGNIPAGKLVIPAGYPGATVVGPTGPTGPQGPQGDPGVSNTGTNGVYAEAAGTNYAVGAGYAQVDFTASQMEVTLPTAGRYLVTARFLLLGVGAVTTANLFTAKLRNTSNNADVYASVVQINGLSSGSERMLTMTVLADTDAANQTISLFAEANSAGVFEIVPGSASSIVYVKLQ